MTKDSDNSVPGKDLRELGKELHKSIINDVSGLFDVFMERVDERFNKLETRVDNIETSLDRLSRTLDTFLKRLDDIEADTAERDAHLARLERWIDQIAQKTGVKLEY